STIEKDLNLRLFPLGLAWVEGAMWVQLKLRNIDFVCMHNY
ncbi:MAG: hypothetical protein RL675_858, partial [Bacteroidota bacterium]